MPDTNARFPTLLSPITINRLILRNRIVSSGHATRLADGNIVSDRLHAYHEARARGGAGMIITESAMVDGRVVASPTSLVAAHDEIIPSFRRLADTLHSHGCASIAQLFHLGHEVTNDREGLRAVSYGPSTSSSERYHTAGREMPHRMVRETIRKFGEAAVRVRQAGMDGAEIAASHGYLIAQFLSPRINVRTDEYGGSFENRLRFLRETIEVVRDAVGPDLVVGMRISGDELLDEGLQADEVLEICQAIGDDGAIDYFNVTSGSSRASGAAIHIVPPMSTGMALTAPFAAAIRDKVPQPVIAVGRINQAAAAEQVLSSGQADLCGMTRAMITDPELGNKLRAGKAEEVRVCIACNQACIDRMHRGYGVSCIQYPETGRELSFGTPIPATVRRKVIVAGGGPGGMKAAATASARGHEVTLHEASNQLGGQALVAQLLPRRAEFGGIVSNLEMDMECAGVTVVLNSRVDVDLICREAPDAVVVATGGTVTEPNIEGVENAHAVNAWQVLEGGANIGARVVIADWRCDWIGLGLAEKLALEGCSVRLASTGHVAGQNIPRYMRDLWLGEMHKLGVELIPMARLFGLDGETAYFQHIASGEPIILEEVDTVVLSLGHVPVTTLEEDLLDWSGEVHVVGDCLAPRTAEEAVAEGMKAGHAI